MKAQSDGGDIHTHMCVYEALSVEEGGMVLGGIRTPWAPALGKPAGKQSVREVKSYRRLFCLDCFYDKIEKKFLFLFLQAF